MEKITPEALAVLKQLGMEPSQLRLVQPAARRTNCLAVANWLMRYRPRQGGEPFGADKGVY